MKVTHQEEQYNLTLEAGDTVQISVNGNIIYEKTVPAGKEILATYMNTTRPVEA